MSSVCQENDRNKTMLPATNPRAQRKSSRRSGFASQSGLNVPKRKADNDIASASVGRFFRRERIRASNRYWRARARLRPERTFQRKSSTRSFIAGSQFSRTSAMSRPCALISGVAWSESQVERTQRLRPGISRALLRQSSSARRSGKRMTRLPLRGSQVSLRRFVMPPVARNRVSGKKRLAMTAVFSDSTMATVLVSGASK